MTYVCADADRFQRTNLDTLLVTEADELPLDQKPNGYACGITHARQWKHRYHGRYAYHRGGNALDQGYLNRLHWMPYTVSADQLDSGDKTKRIRKAFVTANSGQTHQHEHVLEET